MVLGAVQGGQRPDMARVGDGGAVDALQLEQQVVRAGIAVADRFAGVKETIGDVADGRLPGAVIIDAVLADPDADDSTYFLHRLAAYRC